MAAVVVIIFLVVGIGVFIGSAQVSQMKTAQRAIQKSLLEFPNFKADHQFISQDARSAISIDTENRLLCLTLWTNTANNRLIEYRDVLSAEILRDGYSVIKTSRASQAGAALLGGALFGGAGALVGALTGTKTQRGKTNKIDLQIIVNDPHEPIFLVNFSTRKKAEVTSR